MTGKKKEAEQGSHTCQTLYHSLTRHGRQMCPLVFGREVWYNVQQVVRWLCCIDQFAALIVAHPPARCQDSPHERLRGAR